MIRKVLFSLLILVSIALIGFYVYQQTTQVVEYETKQKSPIPKDAVALLEVSNVIESWDEIQNGNLLYEALLNANILNEFDNTWQLIDSNLFKDASWSTLFQNKTLNFSIHPLGAEYDYLLSIQLDKEIGQTVFREKIDALFVGESNWKIKKYEEADIQIFENEGNVNYCVYYKGYFLWSPSIILLENGIRTINNGSSLLDAVDFKKITKVASADKNLHAYLNYKALPEISAMYLQGVDERILKHTLGGWAEFDIGTKPNSILLNGFLMCPDSMNYFLHIFDGQEPNAINITEVMPSNIAWFMHANISDPLTYYTRNNSYWNKLGQGQKIKEDHDAFIDHLGWDPLSFQGLISQEVALAVIEPNDDNLETDYCFFMKVSDEEDASEVLDSLHSAIQRTTDNIASRTSYRSFATWPMGRSNLMEVSFGPLFYMIDHPVFTIIEDNIIVSNSVTTNKKIVNSYLSDQTLAKDIHYNNFMSNTANESNLTIYTNIARAPYYYQNILNEKADEFIEDKIDVFRQFQATSLQFEKSKDGKFYQTFYCKYNPVYKNETSSLWELRLDTSFSQKPFNVLNHNNKEQEVFIQDDRNDLYLISNTGKILWKNKFSEKILGTVYQVDRYQNKKLQLLFVTENYLHLVDRNGKNVEGFPVKLPSKISSNLSLMDYDNNGRFRLLIGSEDGNIFNYDITGRAVEGWAFEEVESGIVDDFRHFKIGTKDFILSHLSDGKMQLINRKGEQRYAVSDSVRIKGDYMLVKRKEIGMTGVIHGDPEGKVWRTQMNGEKELVVDSRHDNIRIFSENKTTRIVGLKGNTMFVYDEKGVTLSQFELTDKLSKIQVHLINKQQGEILISGVSKDNLVFLYNQDGMLQNGFPLTGSSLCNIKNINNDSNLELIIGDKEGMLYTYTLEK